MNGGGDGSNEDDDDGDDVDWSGRELPIDSGSWYSTNRDPDSPPLFRDGYFDTLYKNVHLSAGQLISAGPE